MLTRRKRQVNIFSIALAEAEACRGEFSFTLAPGDTAVGRLAMQEAQIAYYLVTAEGGQASFDLHGPAGGQSVTCNAGRGG
ncbi:hypothetical protein [Marinovum sp.]|uniref:hypothetical protein n=1 Tax=Marinovum sp. TaxID=2024839 RepID=UPI002B275CBA|nr:hypothetical protein [Marinovum sp.]